ILGADGVVDDADALRGELSRELDEAATRGGPLERLELAGAERLVELGRGREVDVGAVAPVADRDGGTGRVRAADARGLGEDRRGVVDERAPAVADVDVIHPGVGEDVLGGLAL